MALLSTPSTADLWWKSAVVYCVDVETFADSDGDGDGDFTGLTDRIDYLADLGVTCLWLMPFFPSPHLDDGYDITDHYGVEPRFGSLGDVPVLLRVAKARGMRVIVDLVVNHTSTRHPWFRRARRSPNSPFRDYYLWSDEQHPPTRPLVFPGEEDEVWTWDEQAGQYYLHHFYSHQPDLNLRNPRVLDEITKIIGFWLELGVDGFRVDAVPFLIARDRVPSKFAADPHSLLRHLRRFLGRRRGDAVLLGEVDLPPEKSAEYFGESGDELQLILNFPTMQAVYLALARGAAAPVAEALATLPAPPESCQWANFLRSHDELTLDLLTAREREEVFAAFGSDEDTVVYGRGLRRRLPPLVDGDQRRLRMLYSLLLTLPGTPVLLYGEEIGLGDNLDLPGRLSVRTPMQWTDDPATGGFSTAPRRKLKRPVPDGPFGPLAVNVADQRLDSDSMLSWMSHAIRRRRSAPEIGWGSVRVLKANHPAVLAHACVADERAVVALHNFCAERVRVSVDVRTLGGGDWSTLFGEPRELPGPDASKPTVDLDPYGFVWLRHDASAVERSRP